MHTLQEFIRFTKGWEYIIAIIGIIVFLVFWQVLGGSFSGKESKEDEKETVRQDSFHRSDDVRRGMPR